MEQLTTARLARIRAERLKLLEDVKRYDLELGRLAKEAIEADQYTTQSAVARVLGVSHTHVRNLIEAAEAAADDPPAGDDRDLPVMLPNELAGDYVRDRGARVVRSISGFEASDVLHTSLLNPRLFENDGLCSPPAMLWHLDTGEWVGVTDATVGYGGTGCDWSRDALVAAGVDRRTAHEIVRWRYCDAPQVDDPSTWTTARTWPAHPRGNPFIVQGRTVVRFGDAVPGPHHRRRLATNDPDPNAFRPTMPDLGEYEGWLQLLDSDQPPPWARGTRVARVFLNQTEAEIQGFVLPSDPPPGLGRRLHSGPSLVVEQGDVQLWGYFFPTEGRLATEVYDALGLADVYPDQLTADEMRGRPVRRLVRRFLGNDSASLTHIDISTSGQDRLSFTPTPNLDERD